MRRENGRIVSTRPASGALGAAALVSCLFGCGRSNDDVDSTGPSGSGVPSSTSAVSGSSTSAVSESSTAGTAPLFGAMPPVVSVAASATAPDLSDAQLITCAPSIASGDAPMIDDLEDGDSLILENEGRSGGWYTYEEQSGDHTFRNAAVAPSRLGSTRAIHSTGTDHGAWAGVGLNLSGSCVSDATYYKGVHFWAKGGGSLVRVALTTPGLIPAEDGGLCTGLDGECWDAFRVELSPTPEWKEYFVPFTEFEQLGYGADAGELDVGRIRTIEFQSEAAPIDLWIDDLSFYIDEVYTPYTPPEADAGTTQPSHDAGMQPQADAGTTSPLPDDGGAPSSPSASVDASVPPPEATDDSGVNP
jgi:Carbohydrate binding domain (family 11)